MSLTIEYRSRRADKGMPQPNRRKRKRRKKKSRVIAARILFVVIILFLISVIAFGAYKIYGLIADRATVDADVTTVKIGKNGSITETIVEEFNPGFYDDAALKSDIEQKIAAAGGRVKNEGLEISDGVAVLKLKYDSDDDMAAFNDEVFYADTIQSLLAQGVSFDSGAISAGGDNAVIVSESMDIRCPKKILYVGGDITIDAEDNKLAHCTTEDGKIAFLIY